MEREHWTYLMHGNYAKNKEIFKSVKTGNLAADSMQDTKNMKKKVSDSEYRETKYL